MSEKVFYVNSSNAYVPDRSVCMTRLDALIAHIENGGKPHPIFFQSQSCANQTYPNVGSSLDVDSHGITLTPEDFCSKNDLKASTCVAIVQMMIVPDNVTVEFYSKEIDNILETGYYKIEAGDEGNCTQNVWSLDNAYNWDTNLAYNRFSNTTQNNRYLTLKDNKYRWQRLPNTIKTDTKDNLEDSIYLCSKRIDAKFGEFKNKISRCSPNNNPQAFGAKESKDNECKSILSKASCGSQFYPFFKPIVLIDNRVAFSFNGTRISNFYEPNVTSEGTFQQCGNDETDNSMSNFRFRKKGSNINSPLLKNKNDQTVCATRDQNTLGHAVNYGSYWEKGKIFTTLYQSGQKEYSLCDCEYIQPSTTVDLNNPRWVCSLGKFSRVKPLCIYYPPCRNNTSCKGVQTNIDRVEIRFKKPWFYTQVDSCINKTPIQLAGVRIKRYEPGSPACDQIMLKLSEQSDVLANNEEYNTAVQCILKQKEVRKQLKDVDVAINCFTQVCNGVNPGVYRLASQRRPCSAKICTQTIKLAGDTVLNSGVQELKCGDQIYNVQKVYDSRTSKDENTTIDDVRGGLSAEDSAILNNLEAKQRTQIDPAFYVAMGVLGVLLFLLIAYGIYKFYMRRKRKKHMEDYFANF